MPSASAIFSCFTPRASRARASGVSADELKGCGGSWSLLPEFPPGERVVFAHAQDHLQLLKAEVRREGNCKP
jgi:hypothetical protein